MFICEYWIERRVVLIQVQLAKCLPIFTITSFILLSKLCPFAHLWHLTTHILPASIFLQSEYESKYRHEQRNSIISCRNMKNF